MKKSLLVGLLALSGCDNPQPNPIITYKAESCPPIELEEGDITQIVLLARGGQYYWSVDEYYNYRKAPEGRLDLASTIKYKYPKAKIVQITNGDNGQVYVILKIEGKNEQN